VPNLLIIRVPTQRKKIRSCI